jgi:hypothetical protein
VESQDENNFELLLTMEEAQLWEWLANIPEEYLDYIEELLDRVENRLDSFLLDNSTLKEAKELIEKVK